MLNCGNNLTNMDFSRCTNCKKEYIKHRANKGNFCSRNCYWNSKKGIAPQNGKLAGSMKGKQQTVNQKEAMRKFAKGNETRFTKKLINSPYGVTRRGFLDIQWAHKVKDRDGHACKISNKDCKGRLEAHHILDWHSHTELRHEMNNGVTLCFFHHPRRKEKAEKLVEFFKNLITK